MVPRKVEPPYGGTAAKPYVRRSISRWRVAVRRAISMPAFPESSTHLETILSRIPALPSKIPLEYERLEGYSTWRNSDPSCSLTTRTERIQRIRLRKAHPTTCKLSASASFRQWNGCANNGICLLVAGWAYVLSASLGERQGIPMEYRQPLSSPAAPTKLNLNYATVHELTWWRAIVSKGVGWSLAGERISPWALSIEDLGVYMEGDTDLEQPPPTAKQAAVYLTRFCHAFDLADQSSASLAAAMSIPLHSTTKSWAPVTIELPPPSFLVPAVSTRRTSVPLDYHLISYYMTLSLSFWAYGLAMWSVFWEPDVPCNLAGAWLVPISTVLQPIIESNNLELLAKTLSFTKAAPLWLGVALCGRGAIIKRILPFLTKLTDYSFCGPDIDSAVWTGIAQSFLDFHSTGPTSNNTITRADVWRLRHDCYAEYMDTSFKYPPTFGWPPFGTMQATEVELEIRYHLDCLHEWSYVDWTWLSSQEKDTGYRKAGIPLPSGNHALTVEALSDQGDLHESSAVYYLSRMATQSVFWWCCEQVEEGFGGTIVPWRRGPDEKLTPVKGARLSTSTILRWLEEVQ